MSLLTFVTGHKFQWPPEGSNCEPLKYNDPFKLHNPLHFMAVSLIPLMTDVN